MKKILFLLLLIICVSCSTKEIAVNPQDYKYTYHLNKKFDVDVYRNINLIHKNTDTIFINNGYIKGKPYNSRSIYKVKKQK